MKIAVLNGSPKGENSVTMQYIRYLEKTLPDFEVIEHKIAQPIAALEHSPEKLAVIAETVRTADAVIWAMPVYHFTVPGQALCRIVRRRGPLGGIPR